MSKRIMMVPMILMGSVLSVFGQEPAAKNAAAPVPRPDPLAFRETWKAPNEHASVGQKSGQTGRAHTLQSHRRAGSDIDFAAGKSTGSTSCGGNVTCDGQGAARGI